MQNYSSRPQIKQDVPFFSRREAQTYRVAWRLVHAVENKTISSTNYPTREQLIYIITAYDLHLHWNDNWIKKYYKTQEN